MEKKTPESPDTIQDMLDRGETVPAEAVEAQKALEKTMEFIKTPPNQGGDSSENDQDPNNG